MVPVKASSGPLCPKVGTLPFQMPCPVWRWLLLFLPATLLGVAQGLSAGLPSALPALCYRVVSSAWPFPSSWLCQP